MSAVAALHAFSTSDDAEDEAGAPVSPKSLQNQKRYEPYRFEQPQPRYPPPLLDPPTPPTTTRADTAAGSYGEEARPQTYFQGGLVGPAAYGQPPEDCEERYTPHQRQPFLVYIS